MKLSMTPEETVGAAQRLLSQVHRHLDNPPQDIDITQAINLLERAMVRLESLRQNPLMDLDDQDQGVRHS
jgi:hypothetical protein